MMIFKKHFMAFLKCKKPSWLLTILGVLLISPLLAFAAEQNTAGQSIPPAKEISDTSGVKWTVSKGVVYKNGNLAGYSRGVIRLIYLKNVIYQENDSHDWWSWNGSGWTSVSNPLVVHKVSPSGTTIPPAEKIVDSGTSVWTVVGGVVYRDGILGGYSRGVIKLLYSNGTIYQENDQHDWWSWNGSGWTSVSNPLAVNGVCGTSSGANLGSIPTTNLCSIGTASSVTGKGPWAWSCAGSNGGIGASCTASLKPAAVNGACSTTKDICTKGTEANAADNGTTSTWSCVGTNGGTTSSCSIPDPVNGVCGTAKSTCSTGTLASVADNGTTSTWSCVGTNGGTTSSCSIPDPVNGACGTAKSTCSKGTVSSAADNGTTSTWTCTGANSGTNASCSIPDPVNGACGSATKATAIAPSTNLCVAGTASSVSGTGPWSWSCAGSNGGSNAACTASFVDTVPPTVPTGLKATTESISQINLAWTASTDNVGVVGYRVYRNGTQVGTSVTSVYSDAGLNASTTYSYTVSAYDAAGNNSGQSAAASATTLNSVALAGSKLGVNLAWVTDWDQNQMFVDLMKQARPFGAPNAPWDDTTNPVPLDANGWPTADFGVVFVSGVADPLNRPISQTYPSLAGTYNLSFNGQATVNPVVCTCQVQNVNYDAATNTTTAQVVISSLEAQIMLSFTNTKGGVQNLKLLAPGYPLGTTQVFTTSFLNALAPFSTLRFMDPLNTNGNPVTSWAGRTQPNLPSQQQPGGLAWEYVIQLANTSGKDIWINIPEGVDLTDTSPNNYITQLATLLKANLNPGIHVYVEYSNEVWNWAFQQATDNLNSAIFDVCGGSTLTNNTTCNNIGTDPSLNFDNNNEWYWALRRTAHQIVRISQLFKNVYGAAAINTTIRPILMSQYVQPYLIEDSLFYINKFFGAPNQYIYAVGGANYFGLPNTYTDLNGLFASLTVGLGQDIQGFPGVYAYNGTDTDWGVPSYQSVAKYYGLKTFAYEGGPGLGDGSGGSLAPVNEQSLSDPRINTMLQQELADWYGCGNDLTMIFELSGAPGDYYAIYRDFTLPTQKSAAVATVSATPLTSYTVCSSNSTNLLFVH